ncbi:MAG TPA: adenine deaminase [Bacteroidales bacterium]|nr:adenine deaminase [Bacteroidales bacterium]HPT02539.1 adenine deaminase [Bacteroidales bacterium]
MEKSFIISGNIVDVVRGVIFKGTVTVENGIIASVTESGCVDGQYILPGFVDAHVHVESSMLVPTEFARLAVVHGTVASVSDPHEIANVLGLDGVKFMIENSRKTPFRFCFGAPSCVPATPFETSGATLGLAEVEELLKMQEIGYLAEMMNFPGVLSGNAEVLAKLDLAKRFGKPVDGHAPGLKGEDATCYIGAGITTDHECYTLDEATEKIGYGMHVLIREGSAARNFDTLLPLLKHHPGKVMFCSDDKHPDDLVEGHINLLVKRAIKSGYNAMDVIRACTLNPVKHYNLACGLLRPGDSADFIVADNLHDLHIHSAFIRGEKVAENGVSLLPHLVACTPNCFHAGLITPESLQIPATGSTVNVIGACDGDLVTGQLQAQVLNENGLAVTDPSRDLLKIAVINRYTSSAPALGFIMGIGLKNGAIASTVAHDSHNIICAGTNDQDMTRAINLLIEHKGGIAAVNGGEAEILPLPVAGLMSECDGYEVARKYQQINRMVKSLGSPLHAPFMTLSFMALLVIPSLKMSDKGLFDGNGFRFRELFV